MFNVKVAGARSPPTDTCRAVGLFTHLCNVYDNVYISGGWCIYVYMLH